jgi:hypothetical protein
VSFSSWTISIAFVSLLKVSGRAGIIVLIFGTGTYFLGVLFWFDRKLNEGGRG